MAWKYYCESPEAPMLNLISTCFLDGGFRSKKRRTSENVEIEDRLESLILRVGEKVMPYSNFICCIIIIKSWTPLNNNSIEPSLSKMKHVIFQSTSSLESNLEGLASVLEADLTTYKAKILKILSECALKLPDKCTIYTTLIGLLNTKNYNFGGEVSQLNC